jgi:hypothetical protein
MFGWNAIQAVGVLVSLLFRAPRSGSPPIARQAFMDRAFGV